MLRTVAAAIGATCITVSLGGASSSAAPLDDPPVLPGTRVGAQVQLSLVHPLANWQMCSVQWLLRSVGHHRRGLYRVRMPGRVSIRFSRAHSPAIRHGPIPEEPSKPAAPKGHKTFPGAGYPTPATPPTQDSSSPGTTPRTSAMSLCKAAMNAPTPPPTHASHR